MQRTEQEEKPMSDIFHCKLSSTTWDQRLYVLTSVYLEIKVSRQLASMKKTWETEVRDKDIFKEQFCSFKQ